MQVCNALEKLNFTFTSINYYLPKPESRSVAAPLDCFGTTVMLLPGTK